jgi:hypothetical protein
MALGAPHHHVLRSAQPNEMRSEKPLSLSSSSHHSRVPTSASRRWRLSTAPARRPLLSAPPPHALGQALAPTALPTHPREYVEAFPCPPRPCEYAEACPCPAARLWPTRNSGVLPSRAASSCCRRGTTDLPSTSRLPLLLDWYRILVLAPDCDTEWLTDYGILYLFCNCL